MESLAIIACSVFTLDLDSDYNDPMGMRKAIIAFVSVWMAAHVQAANIKFSGSPTWKLENGECTFKVTGSIQNLSTDGRMSGTLKLVLWATPFAFPAAGHLVSELNLYPLGSLQQINSFSAKSPANLPALTGSYHFTVTVMENTGNGWATRDYRGTGAKLMENGDFVTGDKWALPNRPVVAPPAKFANGRRLNLTLKSNQEFSAIALDFQSRTGILGTKNSRATVKTGDKTEVAVRSYSVRSGYYDDKRVKFGRLILNYGKAAGSSAPWNTTLTLYFQSSTSGVYKSVEVTPNAGRTTWGVFEYK